jgi:hypothetical protein
MTGHVPDPLQADDLARAREAVIRAQNPSVAALQRRLELGFDAATNLAAQLQRDRVLLCAWPGREPGLHPDYRRVHVRSVQGDARLNYIERVVQLALFFFELAEEDTNGDSRLITAQLPGSNLDWAEVQAQFRETWYGREALSLTRAALAFHDWACTRGAGPSDLGAVEAGIRAGCLPWERPFERVDDAAQGLARAYLRLARFYRRMLREDLTRHTRVADWFVPVSRAPQNAARPGQHPEHVVPCAVMRDAALACFEDHWAIQEVADLLRRWLVVIWIDDEDRHLLDHGVHHLKHRMPDNWNGDAHCLYARLHARGIAFTPAAGFPCTCHAHG